MGRLDGKVAFVTGAARGQGRSHAVRLAQEGADIIAVDICDQIDSVPYPMSGEDDLAETVRLVEDEDRRIVARTADVRSLEQLQAAVGDGVAELGRLDVAAINAGIWSHAPFVEMTEQMYLDMIDVNLNGVWRAARAAAPPMIDGGNGGAIVITSSTAGLKGFANHTHYSSAKTGVVGLMRALANELGPHRIRVNTVHPTSVYSPMTQNKAMWELFVPDTPTADAFGEAFQSMHLLPIPWTDPVDISNAIVFLASDEGRYITGVQLPVDAGFVEKL